MLIPTYAIQSLAQEIDVGILIMTIYFERDPLRGSTSKRLGNIKQYTYDHHMMCEMYERA